MVILIVIGIILISLLIIAATSLIIHCYFFKKGTLIKEENFKLSSCKKPTWSPALITDILDNSSQANINKIFNIKVPHDTKFGAADPFLVKGWVFAELMENNRGYIGVSNKQITKNTSTLEFVPIIRENFHMSYPSVFKSGNFWYMIPETWEDNNVILYKAIKFPFKWKRLKNIVFEYPGLDSIHFKSGNIWYLFTTHQKTGENMFLTTNNFPEGDWFRIKENPFKNKYRGGGSALYINKKVILPVQPPCSGERGYGCEIELWEVTPDLETKKIKSILPKKEALGLHHLSFDPYGTNLFMIDIKNTK
jgi:hypothetical protein